MIILSHENVTLCVVFLFVEIIQKHQQSSPSESACLWLAALKSTECLMDLCVVMVVFDERSWLGEAKPCNPLDMTVTISSLSSVVKMVYLALCSQLFLQLLVTAAQILGLHDKAFCFRSDLRATLLYGQAGALSSLSLSLTPSATTAGRMSHYGKSLVLRGNFGAEPWAGEPWHDMTWKCPLVEQHADVLLFQRVSSTGTVSCLYPLNDTSLLSLAYTLLFSFAGPESRNALFLKSLCAFLSLPICHPYWFSNSSCMFCCCCNNQKY